MAWAVGKDHRVKVRVRVTLTLSLTNPMDDPPKDPSIDHETPCLNGMGSRDMPFEWNSSALRQYIPHNLLGYSKLRTLLVHLGSWPVGKHEQSRDHTNNR